MKSFNDILGFNASKRELAPQKAEALARRLHLVDFAATAETHEYSREFPEIPAAQSEASQTSTFSDSTIAEVNHLAVQRARQAAANAHLLDEFGGQREAA